MDPIIDPPDGSSRKLIVFKQAITEPIGVAELLMSCIRKVPDFNVLRWASFSCSSSVPSVEFYVST